MLSRIVLVIVIVFSSVSCSRNTITGRSQLNIVPESQVQALAIGQYKDFLTKNKVLPSNSKDALMVKRVGNRIAVAIEKYYKDHGMPDAIKGYQWEFNLIENKEVNAWCMPGGKVVCYTNLLPITENETALAIVLGHEITHAVVGHGRERMSQQLLAQGIGLVGDIALGSNPETVNIFNQVYGPTAQVGVLLPNSRRQEYEADQYGLIFAAMAGYNPEEAIPFWKRMAALGGEKPPIFLSDHPADEERIQKLQTLMPEALKYYQASGKH